MVNSDANLATASRLVVTYVALTALSIVALVLLAAVAPAQATHDAWGHAVLAAVFSVLLPLRLRAARRGRPGAARAMVIIATVLAAVNLVEAALPHAFPDWMRVQMVVVAVVAVLLAAVMSGRLWSPSHPSQSA